MTVVDKEDGELTLELGDPSRTPTTGPARRARALENATRRCRSQLRLAWIVADAGHILEDKPIDVYTLCSRGSRTVETATGSGPSGVESVGTSSNARTVSARLGRDLAFPRYFACLCAYVARPNDAFHYNGREKRGLQIRPHSLVIGLSFERTNPDTGESLINDHGLTVYLVGRAAKCEALRRHPSLRSR